MGGYLISKCIEVRQYCKINKKNEGRTMIITRNGTLVILKTARKNNQINVCSH